MSLSVVVMVLGVVACGIVGFRIQRWLWRWQDRAPTSVNVTVIVVVIGLAFLAKKDVVPIEIALPIVLIAITVELVWARIRYSRSPSLRRWEHTWDEVSKISKTDPAAADRLVLQADEADRAELQSLRAAAATDRSAARRFRAGVKRELRLLDKSLARVQLKVPSPGSSPFERSLTSQRARWEAELKWVETILGVDGAA
jgi:hypothetical protein